MSVGLMEYLPDPSEAGHGARKYSGEVAQGYDQKREDSPKWQAEQAIIESMLDELPSDACVVSFPGSREPSQKATQERHPWIVEHYR